jgi:hypothetical protein
MEFIIDGLVLFLILGFVYFRIHLKNRESYNVKIINKESLEIVCTPYKSDDDFVICQVMGNTYALNDDKLHSVLVKIGDSESKCRVDKLTNFFVASFSFKGNYPQKKPFINDVEIIVVTEHGKKHRLTLKLNPVKNYVR